jgi:hypothetical protein
MPGLLRRRASSPAGNRHLAGVVHKWAFASVRRSAWAQEFYDAQRARGKNHYAALRALGIGWLEVLWRCLTHGAPLQRSRPRRQPQPGPRRDHRVSSLTLHASDEVVRDHRRGGLTEDVSTLTPGRATGPGRGRCERA